MLIFSNPFYMRGNTLDRCRGLARPLLLFMKLAAQLRYKFCGSEKSLESVCISELHVIEMRRNQH